MATDTAAPPAKSTDATHATGGAGHELLDLEPPCMAEVITLSRAEPTGARDPQSKATLRDLYEADVACISGHLAAMQTYVFPVASRVLPDGKKVVAGLTLLSREHERVLRVVHAHLRGDVHSSTGAMSELQTQLGQLVAELQATEEDLAERLETVLSTEAVARLTQQMAHASAHGPTRPHPHATHRKGLRRLSFRVCSLIDHSLDTMESRTVHTG